MSLRAARAAAPPAVALLVLVACLPLSAGATAAPAPLRFTAAQKRVLQGGTASVRIALRRLQDRCALAVRYHDGSAQAGLRAAAVHAGVARWDWTVPKDAEAGAARVTVSCTRSGRIARTLVVVGVVLPPKLEVVKQGFSIRTKTFGSEVSYGLILRNDSQTLDALDVTVLVNFVNGANVLYGSATKQVKLLPAGGQYALGGSLSFPGAAPVVSLEAVVQMKGHRQHTGSPVPALANLRLLPSQFEPQWLGSLEGELINDQPALTMQRASLSAVVFDAAGNVVGGATGFASASLPPGSRQFFKATSGLSPIPIEKAVSAQISAVPTYAP